MRSTELTLIPTALAMAAPVQWVAFWDGPAKVKATTRSAITWPFLIQINIQLRVSPYSVFAVPERHFMSAYHVSFFKTLLSSDRHPSKCLQYRIDIADAESSRQAMETACKSFEGLYGAPWNLHADSIDVIADRDSAGAR